MVACIAWWRNAPYIPALAFYLCHSGNITRKKNQNHFSQCEKKIASPFLIRGHKNAKWYAFAVFRTMKNVPLTPLPLCNIWQEYYQETCWKVTELRQKLISSKLTFGLITGTGHKGQITADRNFGITMLRGEVCSNVANSRHSFKPAMAWQRTAWPLFCIITLNWQ